MGSILDQLVKARLQLVAVVASVVGIGLVVLGYWPETQAVAGWVAQAVLDMGRLVAGAGLLGLFIEYVLREHGDLRAVQRFRDALHAEIPTIRDSVWDSWDTHPDTLTNNVSRHRLERVVENGLAELAGDRDLARGIYDSVRRQIDASERWRDVSVTVDLTPWASGPVSGLGSMFVAAIRWEYRVAPAGSVLRFACVSDPVEYRELLRDPSIVSVWQHGKPLDASSREVYELVSLTVDGKARPIRRAQRVGSQLYTATIPTAVTATGGTVVLAYTYRVLVQRHGHVLYLDVPRPAKGLRARFHYGGAGIRQATVLDFITNADDPRVESSPVSVPGRSVDVDFDGWLSPRARVAFVWVLDDEIHDQ